MIYIKQNLKNMGVIIDCNHENSHKQYDDQRSFLTCKMNKSLDAFIKGLMIESYLVEGCQHIGEGIYGKSITDPCLGWDKTEEMIYELAEVI